jgi:signal transduction histidine kinase
MSDSNELKIFRFELQKVADFLPYPFIIAEVIDNVHWNTYLNEKFLEEIGYSYDEIPTIEKWYECAYPDAEYRKKVISSWDEKEIESQREGTVFVKLQSLVTCKNGAKRWYEIKASVINKVHVVAFVDVDNEIVLQEKLKRINENNERMLSILGHDLRGPISNLISISEMASNSEISQTDFLSFISLINERSNQVLEMLDTTLNWAKLNFNVIAQNETEIHFEPLIFGILEIYKNPYKSKNITIQLSLESSERIVSDREIVTIIIRNIISNAIKFTPVNGTISIKIEKNILVVTDTGIGMSEEMINNIWNHNYISNRGTNNEKGIGMGLQLVLQLVEKINCKLTIESEINKGTSISLAFNIPS